MLFSHQVTGDISCDGIVTREQMKTRSTLHFTSDGTHLYWLYNTTPTAAADKEKEKNKQEQVYLETLIVKVISLNQDTVKCSLNLKHTSLERLVSVYACTYTE